MKIPRTLNPDHAKKNKKGKDGKKWEPYDPYKHGVSQTALNIFLDCREKARLKYVIGIKPEMKKAFENGNVLHDIQESCYNAIKNKEVTDPSGIPALVKAKVEEIEEKFEKDGRHQALDVVSDQLDAAMPLFVSYFMHYTKDFSQEWLGVEEEFEYEVIPGVKLKGKFDGRFKKTGLWVFETKFKSRWPDNYSDLLQLDLQVATYSLAASKLFKERLSGCRYNIIRKPQLKIKKKEGRHDFIERIRDDIAERPEFYFERHDIELGKAEIESNERRLKYLVTQFVLWWETASKVAEERDLLFNSNQCEGKYGTCEYLGSCSSGDYSNLKH